MPMLLLCAIIIVIGRAACKRKDKQMEMEYVPAKTIVTRTKTTEWFGMEYNMNIYRGCCHGCIYCDSRSACYGVEEFDRVRAKQDALKVIRDDLRRKIKPGVVGTGAMSDPYNPFEKDLELTRHALELLSAYQFGAAIATKSDLIVRDIDLLREIAAQSPVICKLTVTAFDDVLAKKLEPHAPSSTRRFDAVARLRDADIFAGILLMPVLPFIEDTDENVMAIVRRAGECGARFIYPAFGMTTRQNQREWYLQKLEELFPSEGLRARYEKKYGTNYQCTSPRARTLWKSFAAECDRLGILYHMKDIIGAYKMGYADNQLSFF